MRGRKACLVRVRVRVTFMVRVSMRVSRVRVKMRVSRVRVRMRVVGLGLE